MKDIFITFAMTLGLVSFYGPASDAHEGHDKIPGAILAPHGGTIKGTSQLYVELVNEISGIKLYPMTHEMTPVVLAEMRMIGTAQVPRKKKEPIQFTSADDHFEAQVESKGAYRYTLELTMTYRGKKESVIFQVEPQN